MTPTLTIDLAAIVANWNMLRTRFTGEECAAVVKADAYGLGMVPVVTALERAGCHTFFVATAEEALALRATLPDVRILVLHGVAEGEEFAFAAHRIIPVLNSVEQIARWTPIAAQHVHAVSALHIDTGMGRLGLQPEEFAARLKSNPTTLEACRVGLLMSHLACAPEALHPMNAQQLQRFKASCALAPSIPASLCNSGGIFLGSDYHFHLARPGCSLYGIAPSSVIPSPIGGGLGWGLPQSMTLESAPQLTSPRGGEELCHVATWEAPILQLRTLERTQTIGYGATATAEKGAVIATVASGYADGYLRYLSNKGTGYMGAHRVPLIGRVTMDMLCFDVSRVPEAERTPTITLLGDRDGIRVDDVASAADTIGYEILTRIGARVKRVYG